MNENNEEVLNSSTEKEFKKIALLEESRTITEKIRDIANQMNDHSHETLINSEIPTLEKRLIEIDKELYGLFDKNEEVT